MSSYAIDDGARLLLCDPLSVPDELLELAADREPVVVLTAPWHERDTQSLVERLGVPCSCRRPTPAHGAPTDRAAVERALLLTADGHPVA